MHLRPETWETGALENHEESWRKFKMCQIWRNTASTGRTVYSRYGATPLQQQDCFVRKIPDEEQHRCYYGTVYGSIRSEHEVNTFQIWSNTLTICWLIRSKDSIIQIWSNNAATVYGSIRLIMYHYDFCFFFLLPSSFSTWHRLRNTSHCLHSTEDVL